MEISRSKRSDEFGQILRIIKAGRASAFAAVNVALIETYWAIGQQLSPGRGSRLGQGRGERARRMAGQGSA